MASAAPSRPVIALDSSARGGAISGSTARTEPVFETACRRTGSVFGRTGSVLGRTGSVLGRTGSVLGRTGSVLGRTGSVLGRVSFAGFSSSSVTFAAAADPPGEIGTNG